MEGGAFLCCLLVHDLPLQHDVPLLDSNQFILDLRDFIFLRGQVSLHARNLMVYLTGAASESRAYDGLQLLFGSGVR